MSKECRFVWCDTPGEVVERSVHVCTYLCICVIGDLHFLMSVCVCANLRI